MGVFLRKAFKIAPFRLNLSKSGLGVSAGLKGLRVSTGPRGTRLFAGRHGLYFRERIDAGRRGTRPSRPPVPEDVAESAAVREIQSADAATLIGPDSRDFVRLLEERHRRTALFPVTLVVGILGALASAGLATTGSDWWWLAFGAVACGTFLAGWSVRRWDLDRKTVQVDYEMDDDERRTWAELERALLAIAACRGTWQRTARGDVDDRKRHAGASAVIRREGVSIRKETPPYFKSNVDLIATWLKRQTLYWTPRYMLVYQGRHVGLVRYRDLDVSTGTTQFVEEQAVPGDARVVDRTWRYVNKSGGPDRRFSNNRELPVCLYGEVSLRSGRGLHVELMLSRTDAADALTQAVTALVEYRETVRQRSAGDATAPQAIVFCCHSCGKRFRVRSGLQGKSAKCRACGASLIIPRPESQRA